MIAQDGRIFSNFVDFDNLVRRQQFFSTNFFIRISKIA